MRVMSNEAAPLGIGHSRPELVVLTRTCSARAEMEAAPLVKHKAKPNASGAGFEATHARAQISPTTVAVGMALGL